MYIGREINYIGVGEGFAARGLSRAGMIGEIFDWKTYQLQYTFPEYFAGHELNFAGAGYDYYRFISSRYH